MKRLIPLMIATTLILSSVLSCKSKVDKSDDGVIPPGPRVVEPREPTANCDDIVPMTYIQGTTIDTIYYYGFDESEVIYIKAFPNWYSYFKLHNPEINSLVVPDSCIEEILDDVDKGLALEEDPYENRARIRLHASLDDSGNAYLNGVSVSETGSKLLDTGLYVAPFTPGKNVVAFKTENDTGFGGVIANIYVNDCGEINGGGNCDGSGYDFSTEKPFQINYALPPEITGCFPLYAVDFNGSSMWGLSKSLITDWHKSETMSGFKYIPEGYTQSNGGVGTGTLTGYPEAQWLSSGVDHPYCGPEGYDWGVWDGEDGILYFKTIITCNYYYCWQENTVTKKLFVP